MWDLSEQTTMFKALKRYNSTRNKQKQAGASGHTEIDANGSAAPSTPRVQGQEPDLQPAAELIQNPGDACSTQQQSHHPPPLPPQQHQEGPENSESSSSASVNYTYVGDVSEQASMTTASSPSTTLQDSVNTAPGPPGPPGSGPGWGFKLGRKSRESDRDREYNRKRSQSSGRTATSSSSKGKLDLNKPLPDPEEQQQKEASEQLVTCGFEDEVVRNNRYTRSPPKGRRRSYHFPHETELREHQRYLDYILQEPPDKIILEFHDVSVYRADLDNLGDDAWLNDNNLSFAYEYLEHTTLKQFNRKMPHMIQLVKPSIAYLLLHAPDLATVVGSALPPMDKARFLFLPLNDNPDVGSVEGGTHWSLLVVSVFDKRALYYDSMYSGFVTAAGVAMAKRVGAVLGFSLELVSVNTPQQVNGSDCGIIVAEITALLLNRLVQTDGQKPINLGLDDVSLLASAGRRFLLSRVLALSARQAKRNKI